MADNMSPKYKKYVKGYTGYLRSKDVEKRRKGARMVGELGAAESIETLIDLSENDSDAEVRKNAKYSLGMFAAFKEAVESDDEALQDEAIEALTHVMETAQIPKISPQKSGGGSSVLTIIMGVVLALLIAGNVAVFFLLPGSGTAGGGDNGGAVAAGGNEPEDIGLPEAPDQDVEVLITQGRDTITALTGNAGTLRAQLEPIVNGETPDQNLCLQNYDAQIAAPGISADDAVEYPGIVAIYRDIDAVRQDFNAIHDTIETVCFDGVAPDTVDAQAELDVISAFETNAPVWSADLAEARELPTQAVPPTDAPEPTAEPAVVDENATEEPTATATEPPDVRRHVAAIVTILDEAGNDAEGARSIYSLLEQYWTEAQANSGITNGCRNTALSVPPDYILAEFEDYDRVIAAAPQLEPAIDQTNAGLALLREQVTAFRDACAGGETAVLNGASGGLAALEQIRLIFDNAEQQINILLES